MVQHMQVSNYTRNEKDILLTSMGPALMSILLNYMASARLFIREEIHHAACTSVSITTSTRKGVKKETYLLTIGWFHETFGKSWGRRRRWNGEVKWMPRQGSRNWILRQWLAHASLQGRRSSTQSQTSSQLTIKWVVSTCHQHKINYDAPIVIGTCR